MLVVCWWFMSKLNHQLYSPEPGCHDLIDHISLTTSYIFQPWSYGSQDIAMTHESQDFSVSHWSQSVTNKDDYGWSQFSSSNWRIARVITTSPAWDDSPDRPQWCLRSKPTALPGCRERVHPLEGDSPSFKLGISTLFIPFEGAAGVDIRRLRNPFRIGGIPSFGPVEFTGVGECWWYSPLCCLINHYIKLWLRKTSAPSRWVSQHLPLVNLLARHGGYQVHVLELDLQYLHKITSYSW